MQDQDGLKAKAKADEERLKSQARDAVDTVKDKSAETGRQIKVGGNHISRYDG